MTDNRPPFPGGSPEDNYPVENTEYSTDPRYASQVPGQGPQQYAPGWEDPRAYGKYDTIDEYDDYIDDEPRGAATGALIASIIALVVVLGLIVAAGVYFLGWFGFHRNGGDTPPPVVQTSTQAGADQGVDQKDAGVTPTKAIPGPLTVATKAPTKATTVARSTVTVTSFADPDDPRNSVGAATPHHNTNGVTVTRTKSEEDQEDETSTSGPSLVTYSLDNHDGHGNKPHDTDLPGTNCGSTGTAQVAAGTPNTSCDFALAVAQALESNNPVPGAPISVTAHSAVTNRDYGMTCTPTGNSMWRCTGSADGAVVTVKLF